MEIKINEEIKNRLWKLNEQEYDTLEQSIINEGCRDALVLWGDTLVDGHNRYEICKKHHIQAKVVKKEFESLEAVLKWVDENQLSRRNLEDWQRRILRARISEANKMENDGRRNSSTGKFPTDTSQKQIAKELNVDVKTLYNDTKFLKAYEDVERSVGKERVDELARIITAQDMIKIGQMDPFEQEKIINKIKEGDNNLKDVLKQNEIDKRKEEYKEAAIDFKSNDIKIINTDFYSYSKNNLKDNSIDLILTDPPYPEEYLPLWEQLFEVAYKILKPSAFLVAYSGHMHLDKIFKMKNDLIYYWCANIQFTVKPIVAGRNIVTGWKPILIFQKPPFKKLDYTFNDTLKFEYTERDLHDKNWGQTIEPFEYLLEHFSKPGELVFEPFSGTGTTLIASKNMMRKCIGCELDKELVEITKGRLSKNNKI